MAFSPQSDKLAIAQTDNMVFVYKIGSEWGDKKSICNKFQHSSPVTSLVWPTTRTNDIIYGLAEGKVKLGQLKTHQPNTLYSSESYVTALACNPEGTAVVSAHLDGSIYTCWFDTMERGGHVIARHPSVPFALAWGGSICVAGSDKQIIFYDQDGGEEHCFDHSNDPRCKEFTTAVSNPTGDSIVLGNFDSMYVYGRNKDTMGWEEKGVTTVENMYSVTAMDWKSDGSKLAVGTLCGIVDLYDVCLKRTMYKGGFELTYVSHSQVIVRQVDTDAKIVVRSNYGFEITKTNIFQSRYVVANTTETLLLGDLQTLKMSEVKWHGNGTEKFIFDNPAACIVYFAGELSIIEFGVNEVLGSIRTSNINRYVLSLRINERPPRPGAEEDNKKIAFLLDAQTVCIRDLSTMASTTVAHDVKIDFLELNGRANLLLFRDKRRHLHLFNVDTQQRTQLLQFCTYVQWVPQSDVVVAQSRGNLCVWYNINSPDQVTLHAIKGEVEDIERSEGRTDVVVDEGIEQAVYPLEQSLIEFGTAIDDHQFAKAMDILEKLEVTSETEAMWRQLSDLALEANDLRIAQRCAVAVGDVARAKYLGRLSIIKDAAEEELGLRGEDHYMVRYRMAMLRKDLREAENILLTQNKVDECIEMYQKLLKFDQAIRVAELRRHPEAAEMRQAYYQYLLDNNQEEGAAALKEKEHDYITAINLYLKAGLPAKAAQVINNNNISQPISLLEQIASALTKAGMHDLAGEFFEKLDELQRALDSYIRGHAYRRAVDLARRTFPGRVVELQDMWGDYLVSQKQVDMAINHYIEAKVYQKAIEAALNARQFSRALQLVDAIDRETAKPYYRILARQYEETGQYDQAEKCFIAADQANLAVEMRTGLGHWEVAHKLAMSYMSEGEVGLLYINQAQKLEAQGKFREAEKLYLTVKERDLAINMYKKHRRFEDMIRLVQEYRPDLLKETHQFLAQTLEMEGSLREAEHHYVEAQEWHSAVNMYRSNDLWDDAIRIAKFHGGLVACKRVALALLTDLGVPQGAKYLVKHSLVEPAVDIVTETGAFEIAFELANSNAPKKLLDIHFKYALFLEEQERFKEAETEFVKAGKATEAIDMYVHQHDWASALRVAEGYDPQAVSGVYVAQAQIKVDSGDHKAAEDLYLLASRPDLALQMYQDASMWSEAIRLAQLHLPHKLSDVNMAAQQAQARSGKGGNKRDLMTSGKSLEQSKQYQQAIDVYLAQRDSSSANAPELEEVWLRAVNVARSYVPNKYVEVAVEVARRLVNLRREEVAADVLFECGRTDEAVSVCIDASKWDKAKSLAQGSSSLKKRVDEAYQGYLVSAEDTKELVGMGRTDAALDVLAKKGEWDRLWDVAAREKLGAVALGKFVSMRVEELMKGRPAQVDEAVFTLQKQPCPTNDSAVSMYARLVQKVLSRSASEEKGTDYPAVVAGLRDVMYKLANTYRSQSGSKKLHPDLEESLMATHYMHMYLLLRSNGLKEPCAKVAITLMKYPDAVPMDKAFYLAGTAARMAGNTNLAFMLLNKYVDITEAIDTGDMSFMDNSDYSSCDAIPMNVPLPARHYVDSEVCENKFDYRFVISILTPPFSSL
jgi:intraflagellar transport protein 172